MVEITPTLVVIIMFSAVIVGVLLGYPLFVCLGAIGMIVGFLVLGPPVFNLLRGRAIEIMTNYILLAVPLFIFMGTMVERSGAAEKLYGGLYLWFGGFRGGLAIVTVLMGTVLAACVGVIIASVSMIGLIALPGMLKRRYNKELACGSTCAGGTLGILIPPSVMLVIYGPMAQLSVGKLFMAAIVPGLLLSGLYISYISISCWLKPEWAPSIPVEERTMPILKKILVLVTGSLPTIFIILAVLGSIFFAIATPTEAAAIGCVATIILALAYRKLNLQTLKEVTLQTMRVTCMAMIIGITAFMFTGVFLRLGGGEAIRDMILAAPGGKWGIFALIMFIVFILGMFIDWLGILFVMVPLITPIAEVLGFNEIWFAMMLCVNLQMSFLTPPFAYAIFFLKGLAKPEWGIEAGHIIRGVIPFIILIMVGLGLCILFPQIILWLPGIMIK